MNQEIQPLFNLNAVKIAVGNTPDLEVATQPKRQQFSAAPKREGLSGDSGSNRCTKLPK